MKGKVFFIIAFMIVSDIMLSQNLSNNNFVFGDRQISLNNKFKGISFQNFGYVCHSYNIDSVKLEMALFLDFYFDKEALDIIVESIYQNKSLNTYSPINEKYMNTLQYVLTSAELPNAVSQLTLNGKLNRITKNSNIGLFKTFVLGNVKFRWNNNTQSFVSFDQIGVCNILEKQLYKYIDGIVEIKNTKQNEDLMTIYLSPKENEWYLIQYDNQALEMIVYSSNIVFNQRISQLPEKQRTTKIKGVQTFAFKLTTKEVAEQIQKELLLLKTE